MQPDAARAVAGEVPPAPAPPAQPPEAYVAALDAPPSNAGAAWSDSGKQATTRLAADERSFQAQLPPLETKLTGAGTRAVERVRPPAASPEVAAQLSIAKGEPPAQSPAPAPTT